MKRIIILLFIVCVTTAVLFGSVSQIFKWRGTTDIGRAEVENVIIDEKGFITLAPGVDTLFQSTEVFLWDCEYDSRGNLFVASGNDGKVFRVTPEGQVFTVFTADEGSEVFAIAIDRNDYVYVGESPSGKIYQISRNGKQTEFFETGEQYIWDLLFSKKGNLLAATGDRGILFSISGSGKGTEYYVSTDNHIVSLLLHEGRLYAGTEPSGLFVEILRKDDAIVLFDSDESEVSSLAGLGNTLFFSTLSAPLSVNQGFYTPYFGDAYEMPKTERSVLYKFDIEKNTVIPLWECPAPPIYSLGQFGDSEILIGSENGKLYASDVEGNISQVNQIGNSPILEIKSGRRKNSNVILTGNLGNVIGLGPDLARTGTITSDVLDTQRNSVFGRIDWIVESPSGTSFSLWARTGNKQNPDEDWTEWKKMSRGGEIKLHSARFIQIKSELSTSSSGKTPLLKEVTFSYLPENRKPFVKMITVCPVGVNASEGYDPSIGPQIMMSEKDKLFYLNLGYYLPPTLYELMKGKRCAIWNAGDPDGDTLTFTFYYRGEGEKEWKELKKDIKINSCIWDETTLPDGKYYAKVSASDELDNPSHRALVAELVSEPFTIDNTGPTVVVNSVASRGEEIEVSVTASDELSFIKSASYSVNGGKWNLVLPEDGMFDRREEEFKFSFKKKESGEYTVVVMVVDFALNKGSGKGSIQIR
jgi:hypothetical protein